MAMTKTEGKVLEGKRRGAWRWLPVVLIVLVIAGSWIFIWWRTSAREKEAAKEPPIAWEEIEVVLEEAVQSDKYKEGKKIVETEEGTVELDREQARACHYFVAIDFLRSVSPEQAAILEREEELPFASLTEEQQAGLLHYGEILKRYKPESTPPIFDEPELSSVSLQTFSPQKEPESYGLDWSISAGGKGKTGVYTGIMPH